MENPIRENTENKSVENHSNGYYIVDFDSSGIQGLDGISGLLNGTVIIFYTAKHNSITFEVAEKIMRSPAEISFSRIDKPEDYYFVLSTHLGFIVGAEPNKKYIIVSNSEQVNTAVSYWTKKDIDIKVLSNISGKNRQKRD